MKKHSPEMVDFQEDVIMCHGTKMLHLEGEGERLRLHLLRTGASSSHNRLHNRRLLFALASSRCKFKNTGTTETGSAPRVCTARNGSTATTPRSRTTTTSSLSGIVVSRYLYGLSLSVCKSVKAAEPPAAW
eukprot:3904652-Rhodomonas_salina.1